MIKLKISSREMQAIIRYLQISIEIARMEISNGMDITVHKFEDSSMVKPIPWGNINRNENVIKISERHAHIDEFERLQRKLLLTYDAKRESKGKTISITKSSGHFFILYLSKVEYGSKMVSENIKGMDYVNFVASTQAGVILQNMV